MYLTNSPIVIPSEDVTYSITEIDEQTASDLLFNNQFTSAIGHQSTVSILKSIFPQQIVRERILLNRIVIDSPVEQIVFKLKGRLPEGKILTINEIKEIGYSFWHVVPEPRCEGVYNE